MGPLISVRGPQTFYNTGQRPVEIKQRGKIYTLKAANGFCIRHTLILGTDWCMMSAALSGDMRSSNTDHWKEETTGPLLILPVPVICSIEEFSPEKSHDDTLRSDFDQVIQINGAS